MSDTSIPYRKAYVFLIGITQYDIPRDDPSQALHSYQQISKNLYRLGQLLPECLLCQEVQVEPIPNPGSLSEITDHIRQVLPKEAPPSHQDTLIVLYYAGHASPDKGKLHLSLRTTTQASQRDDAHTFFPHQLLGPLKTHYRRQPIWMILDCCFSGTAMDSLSIKNWPQVNVLFASQAGERAKAFVEQEKNLYTCFTGALIKALTEGWTKEKYLSLDLLEKAIMEHLPADANQRPWLLAPELRYRPFFKNPQATTKRQLSARSYGKLPDSEEYVIDCDQVTEKNLLRAFLKKPHQKGPRLIILEAANEDRPMELLRSLLHQLNRKHGVSAYPNTRLLGRDGSPYIEIDGSSPEVFQDDLAEFLKVNTLTDAQSLLKMLATQPWIVTPLFLRKPSKSTKAVIKWYVNEFWNSLPGAEKVLIPVIRLKPSKKSWSLFGKPTPLIPAKAHCLQEQLTLEPVEKAEILHFLDTRGYHGMLDLVKRGAFQERFLQLAPKLPMEHIHHFLKDLYHYCRS